MLHGILVLVVVFIAFMFVYAAYDNVYFLKKLNDKE